MMAQLIIHGNIAKEYAEKFSSQITYLKKENGGLSDARNYGLEYTSGDYIAFVDSDDYISENLYENLLPYMNEKYDMVKIKIELVGEDGKTIKKNESPEFKDKNGEEAFEILYKTDVMTEVAWGYIYRRDFWMKNNFKFAKGMYHEDFGLIPIIMLNAKKVASSLVGTYFYVQTEHSITRGNPERKCKMADDLILHYDNMLKTIENMDISKHSKENIKIYYTNCLILETDNLNGKLRKDYIKKLKERKLSNNIKPRNLKQILKKLLLNMSVELYLSLR